MRMSAGVARGLKANVANVGGGVAIPNLFSAPTPIARGTASVQSIRNMVCYCGHFVLLGADYLEDMRIGHWPSRDVAMRRLNVD
jgi:hypothetical protein